MGQCLFPFCPHKRKLSNNAACEQLVNSSQTCRQQTLIVNSYLITRDYIITKKVLGRGHSGSVHVAVRKSDGKKFALKVLLDLPQARREVELQYAAQGPNVVEIKDVYANIYCERRCLFVVMEHMGGGQLFDRIKQGQLTERDAARIMQQLCSAVAHLHSLNIAHRDIKPENVLYSSNGILKLCDFGFAKRIEESAEKPLHTVCYSNYYAPPEILQRLCYDKSCDMWSLGVVMYILLCGYPPFYSKSGDDFSMGMQRRIKAGQYDFPSPEWDFISDQAKALIKNLLVTDPCQRLTIEQLMQSEWITHCIIAPKTPLHTSKMLTEEQMQDINEAMVNELKNMRYSEEPIIKIKPLNESNNQILVRRRQMQQN